MEQIILKHPDGTQIEFPDRELCAVPTSAIITQEHQSTHALDITIASARAIDFVIGDTITALGTTYTLQQLPRILKSSESSYQYVLKLEAPQYRLLDVQFLLSVESKNGAITGDFEDFLDLIISNANRVYSDLTWAKGTIQLPEDLEEETKTIDYTDSNCLSALQDLCSQYEVEFGITQEGSVFYINIAPQIGSTFATTFQYGRGKGLYSLERNCGDAKDIITRLYCYGSTNNLPTSYKASNLCLPDATGRNDSYIESEEMINKYGVREGILRLDDIYPKRVGVVSSVVSLRVFTDDDMDFDLNETDESGNTKWLISGETAKITFQSGNLAGYSFDLSSYDNTLKKFVINGYKDENGYEFPNPDSSAFQIGVGDKYIITGIRVPQSYIDEAESLLQSKAQDAFSTSCQPQVNYALNLDPMYLKELNDGQSARLFNSGDTIKILDSVLAEDEIATRITSMTIDLLHDYTYTLTLGDSVSVSTQTRLLTEVKSLKEVIEFNDMDTSPAMARRWRASEELKNMVFDPEGNYYTDKIKPLSIETTQLSVGARSQQFQLVDVRFQVNPIPEGGTEQDCNALKVVGGQLHHFNLNEDMSIRVFNITGSYIDGLITTSAYYLYAKCQREKPRRVNSSGSIIASTSPHVWDEDQTYYYFLIGVLSTPVNTEMGRLLTLNTGTTTINGEHVQSGVIKSNNGKLEIDLNNSTIYSEDGITFKPTGSSERKSLQDINNTANQAVSDASSAYTRAELAESNASADATSKANQAKSDAISTASADATSKANSAKTDAISTASADATTKANKALSDAKSYADTEVGKVKTTADDAQKKANDLAFLNNSFMEAQDGSTKIKGGLVLSEMIATKDATSDKVTAMMDGRATHDSDIAIACGSDVLGGDAPFKVRHDGSVEMSKAEISSGTEDKIKIANGVISLGDDNETEIVGYEAGSVKNMIDSYMGGGSYNTPVSLAKVEDIGQEDYYVFDRDHTSGECSCRAYVNTYKLIYNNSSNASVLYIDAININAQSVYNYDYNNCEIRFISRLSNLKIAIFAQAPTETTYTEISGTAYEISQQNPFSGTLKIRSQSIKMQEGYKYYIGYYANVGVEMSGTADGSSGNMSLQVSATFSASTVRLTTAKPKFNNVLFNDGYLVSSATDRYIAMCPNVTNDSISIFRAVNGQNSGIDVTKWGVNFVMGNEKNAPIGKLIMNGYMSYSNGSISTTNDLNNSVSLVVESIQTGRYNLKITASKLATTTKIAIILSPQEGYVTDMWYEVSNPVLVSDHWEARFFCLRGTTCYNWWANYSYDYNGSTAKSMSKVMVKVIAY